MAKKVTSKVLSTSSFIERRSKSRPVNPPKNKYRRFDDINAAESSGTEVHNPTVYTSQAGRLKACIDIPVAGQVLNYYA